VKVLVAMSGGVDSSVATAILVEAGHDVTGATLKLWGGPSDSGCCSVSDVDDARRVAQVLGVDHHVFNYTEEFEHSVVAPFVAGHARGESPNPCIDCNRFIKFDLLFDRAQRLGFDAVATGHHAQVRYDGTHYYLVRGADQRKDQSYVLGYLNEAQLSTLLLPIGHLNKDAVRAEAERLGLRTWNKPDSQDVCFIESSQGREQFLSSRIDLTAAEIIDRESGQVVGSTRAAELLTVGQRRGVMPGRDGTKRFVARVDLPARRVEVDRLENIEESLIDLDTASFTVARGQLSDGQRFFAQWSAHGIPAPVTLRLSPQLRLELDAPARPVAAGQSVVLYDWADPSVVAAAALVVRR
jgi:tRNA-uridine 2-sulfurtransferase